MHMGAMGVGGCLLALLAGSKFGIVRFCSVLPASRVAHLWHQCHTEEADTVQLLQPPQVHAC